MFDFLKSKPERTAADMGLSLARFIPKILEGSENEALEKQIDSMVGMGASSARLRPELASFAAFATLRGIGDAAREGKISETLSQVMIDAFYKRLEEQIADYQLDTEVSVSYSSFHEYFIPLLGSYLLMEGIERTEAIAESIVERFCDYACDDMPTKELKAESLDNYLSISRRVFTYICEFKIV
jgi:hypothetical protein